MKKGIIIAAAAILGTAAVVLVCIFAFQWVGRMAVITVPDQYADQICVYEDGDFVYRFEPEDITADTQAAVLYVKNLLVVYTKPNLSPAEKLSLAKQVDGTVVGNISGCINALQIRVEEPELAGLEALAEKLMESDKVYYAEWDSPLWMDAQADQNRWSYSISLTAETDRGNEAAPGGNDWWAEAVGAYTAWSYEDLFQDVTVGILDSGFNLEHEDLEGNLVSLPGYEENTASSHGTGVAGIIGAKNNTVGLRGVASGSQNQVTMLCADWSPYSNDDEDWWYLNYLSTGEYLEIIKQMVGHGTTVINHSWGINIGNWLNWIGTFIEEGVTPEQQKQMRENLAEKTALNCMLLMLELLENKQDVLIVQSAGNDTDLTEWSGYFCGIDRELWDSQILEKDFPGITYEDISQRILIVAAVKNQRDGNGNYELCSFSSYGEQVRLCAPGEEIFTADKFAYHRDQGTSYAAPIVAGSAAALWALDPELSAPQVYELLTENTVGYGVAGEKQEGIYPMVNVGAAVEKLLEEKDLKTGCAVSVKDAQTGEPVKDAEVILLNFDNLGIDFGGTDTDLLSQVETASVRTDSGGAASFYNTGLDPYPACVRADGYGEWRGWLECSGFLAQIGGSLQVNEVLLSPGPAADELLLEKLKELAGQNGVMAVGTETYTGSGYGGGEQVVPAQRLTGCLCGDIWDYDGDGQSELLMVGAQPDDSYELGAGEDGTLLWITVAVYEAEETGQVSLADEKTIGVMGLTDTIRYSSVQFTRGSENGQTILYLDHYLNMNSQSFEVFRIQYSDRLQVSGGVRCYEFEGAAGCDTGASDKALEELNTGGLSSENGWVLGERYDWEEISSEIPAGMMEQYRQDWQNGMAGIGLESSFFRTMYEAPEIVWAPDGGTDMTAYFQYFYDCCTSRPAACWTMTGGGAVTELCGFLSAPDHEAGMELTTYDSPGLLQEFR